MSDEKLFTQYDWDTNEDDWHRLTSAWKVRTAAAEAELVALLDWYKALTEPGLVPETLQPILRRARTIIARAEGLK